MTTKIDFSVLDEYHKNKLLKKQKHPKYDLYIWNYSEIVQYSRKWDSITRLCRGLITDKDGNIIARSFEKFFNYEEQDIKEATNFRIFDKADGSMGILFYYNNEWIFTSRGSFDSEQAIKGYSMIPSDLYDKLDKKLSYIFEIIYPENRIVVNYGPKECLLYITSFRIDGTEVNMTDFMKNNNIEIVEEYTHLYPDKINFDDLKKTEIDNKEGYVIMVNDTRIKIKFSTYLKLSKMKSNVNVKNIYMLTKTGTTFENILEGIPDENHEWCDKVYKEIFSECDYYRNLLIELYNSIYIENMSKKDFVYKCSTIDPIYKPFLFKMFDGKSIDTSLFELVDIPKLEKKYNMLV